MKYIVSGYVKQEKERRVISKAFKTKTEALIFKKKIEKEPKNSTKKYKSISNLRIIKYDTGFPESRWQ